MLANRPGGKIETHVPGFDLITGGGLIKSSAILFIGDLDGRKELLARHIVWNLLQEGDKVLYYTVDQSAEDLRYDMVGYGWDVKPFEDAGKLRIVDMFSDAVSKMKTQTLRMIEGENSRSLPSQEDFYDPRIIGKEGSRFFPISILEKGNKIAVIDSLSPLLTKSDEIFHQLQYLKFATRLVKATGIGIMHGGIHDERVEETIKSFADGIIKFTRVEDPLSSTSLIEIIRYAGEYKRGSFPIEADSGGLRIIPIVLPVFQDQKFQ